MPTSDPDRRTLLRTGLALAALPGGAVLGTSRARAQDDSPAQPLGIGYLEIVTRDVDAVCATYARSHGVAFGERDAVLGGARTTTLPGGGLLGVRAPLRESEAPVVRPYFLVDDIEAAVEDAVASGAVVAHPPMELPGRGTFAIFIQGGSELGLWQV